MNTFYPTRIPGFSCRAIRTGVLLLAFFVLGGTSVALSQSSAPVISVTGAQPTPFVSQGLATPPLVIEVAPDTDIDFCWTATSTVGLATSRYGWDIVDPNNPFDPGWFVAATPYDGLEQCSVTQNFAATGFHNFFVEVTDTSGNVSRAGIEIFIRTIIPTEQRRWGTLKDRWTLNL